MVKPAPQNINAVVSDLSVRLDLFLSQTLGISRTHSQEEIVAGRIQVNGKVITKAAHKVQPGDQVLGTLEKPARIELEPIAGPLDILFEDEFMIAVNKPQGLVVHPAASHKGPTLVHYLLHHLKSAENFKETSPIRPGIVHRLDRGTSGVILIAKDRATHESLSKSFRSRQIKKEYEAIVWGIAPESGRFESQIGRDPRSPRKMSGHSLDGRLAITDFTRLSHSKHFSHVELRPFTGRTHQLRVHLSENKLPVLGDKLYGPIENPILKSLSPQLIQAIETLSDTLLHAKKLHLTHPSTGESLTLEGSHPPIFDKFLQNLRNFDHG